MAPALSYGPIRYVYTRYVYPDDLEELGETPEAFSPPQDINRLYMHAAFEFKPAADHLLIAGDHLQLLMFAGHLTTLWGQFRVLRYDRQAEGYLPVELKFPYFPPELNPNTARGA
jgi:hypothetical protein